jgi:hypothetical protein
MAFAQRRTHPHPPSPYQRHDVLAAREHPGDRELRDGCALLVRDDAHLLDEPEVAVEVVAAEARHVAPEVAGRERPVR